MSRRIGEGWNPVTIHHVIASFLRAEAYRLETEFNYRVTEEEDRAIHSSDFDNETSNDTRARLLCQEIKRGAIFARLPDLPQTQWFEVNFRQEELADAYVIPVKNFLRLASHRGEQLRTEPEQWERPVFWGRSQEGPFTILEGNRRLMAYVHREGRPPKILPVYVGLSDTNQRCPWHLPDWFQIPL